ncbi:MAG: acyl-CoA dehydrogenase [Pseudomonadota bacterium]
MGYRAPTEEMAFTLEHVAGLAQARGDAGAAELAAEDVEAILTEAGRYAEEVLAPLNRGGDTDGAALKDGKVTVPAGWKEAYDGWVEGGWATLTGAEAYGGQGLPMALQVATTDIWNQANPAFAINPVLTICAIEAIEAHGSDTLKARYLPHLISGRWTWTMNLTEPHAGSDLAELRTRAEPQADGTYRLFGQKIYITYGEHDLTENIIHMVLARLPDAPAGTKGISLFLVPKILVNEDGSLGEPNDLVCGGVEHKLGLHGSPTCTMIYGAGGDGAVGTLVGEPNRGLYAMFTMMNNARVQVGMQGAAVAERAFQQAAEYAAERRQGRVPGVDGMVPINAHPDVKRMLLAMETLTKAARAICYSCAVAIDRGRDDPFWQKRADLLTPLAKAFATDAGVEVASMGIQVHGGMGYVEETGAAQHYRDARIFPIYEGTNGIQAIDLVRRKIGMDEGAVLSDYLAELRAISDSARGANAVDLAIVARRLDVAIDAVEEAAGALRDALGAGAADRALAGATPFLRALATTAGGAYLAKAATVESDGAPRRAALARFFAQTNLIEVPPLCETATDGAASVLDPAMAPAA